MPGGPKLTPSDPEKKALMEKWLESGKMLQNESMQGWSGMSKRLGKDNMYQVGLKTHLHKHTIPCLDGFCHFATFQRFIFSKFAFKIYNGHLYH